MKKIIASLLCGLLFAVCTGKQTEGNHQGNVDMGHGTHTIDHAEAIGLGTKKYTIVNIDK